MHARQGSRTVSGKREVVAVVLEVLALVALARFLRRALHTWFVASVAAAAILALDLARRGLRRLGGPNRLAARVLLSVTAAGVTLTGLEALLALGMLPLGHSTPVIPDRLRKVPLPAPAPGCAAFRWQGQLHVQNAYGVRMLGDIPPKTDGVFRVAVCGDSVAYGVGVAAEEAFPALLNRRLEDQNIEVLNLGITGHQTEDLLRFLRNTLDQVQPDLAIYGFYFNDFLPSHKLGHNVRLQPVSPGTHPFIHRSRLLKSAAASWKELRLRLHMDQDAWDSILVDFEARQQRVRSDVEAMNAALAERGLPPLLAVSINQFPEHGARSNEVAAAAEQILEQAGCRIVPTAEFTARHDGESFVVSPWESHPSARFHELLAELLLPAVQAAVDQARSGR